MIMNPPVLPMLWRTVRCQPQQLQNSLQISAATITTYVKVELKIQQPEYFQGEGWCKASITERTGACNKHQYWWFYKPNKNSFTELEAAPARALIRLPSSERPPSVSVPAGALRREISFMFSNFYGAEVNTNSDELHNVRVSAQHLDVTVSTLSFDQCLTKMECRKVWLLSQPQPHSLACTCTEQNAMGSTQTVS